MFCLAVPGGKAGGRGTRGMSGDARSGKEVLETGLKSLQTALLKVRNLPGKVKLNRREVAGQPPSACDGQADYSGRSQECFTDGMSEVGGKPNGQVSALAAADSLPPPPEDSDPSKVNQPRLSEDASTSGMDSPVSVGGSRSVSSHRVAKFQKLLAEPVVDVDALRELAWSGIPPDLRPTCWRLLLGYLPPNKSRQQQTLQRKRREYQDMVPEFYDIANSERSEEEVGALRQVSVDCPRTAPTVPFFQEPVVQKSLERMLYIWGIRHPASGYVQGMNDLVTPFLEVFLSECLEGPVDVWKTEDLSDSVMLEVEADCYWCLCKLLEGIQDHYTYAQPGIQRTVFKLKELILRIDEPVARHLDEQQLDFLQFAFRWVNCLLIREVPFQLAARLWDTYLAEGPKLPAFLVYLCAAFLLNWSDKLREMEFQDLVLFLQKLPTNDWDEKQMEFILSRAYMWRASFDNAQSHLKS